MVEGVEVGAGASVDGVADQGRAVGAGVGHPTRSGSSRGHPDAGNSSRVLRLFRECPKGVK